MNYVDPNGLSSQPTVSNRTKQNHINKNNNNGPNNNGGGNGNDKDKDGNLIHIVTKWELNKLEKEKELDSLINDGDDKEFIKKLNLYQHMFGPENAGKYFSDPVRYLNYLRVCEPGIYDSTEKFIFIDAPGIGTPEEDALLSLMEKDPLAALKKLKIDPAIPFELYRPQTVDKFIDLFKSFMNNGLKNANIVIFGIHGIKGYAGITGDLNTDPIIEPTDLEGIDLDDSNRIYNLMCYQGKFNNDWADAYGVPKNNVFGYYPETVFGIQHNLIFNLIRGIPMDNAWNEFTMLNNALTNYRSSLFSNSNGLISNGKLYDLTYDIDPKKCTSS